MTRATKERDKAHARIYTHWLELPAWRALSPSAVSLLVGVLARYRPGSNPMQISDRQAAAWANCSRPTAAAALVQLEKCGWLEVVRFGRMDGERATRPSVYRITRYPTNDGLPATEDFLGWREPLERPKSLPALARNCASNGINPCQPARWDDDAGALAIPLKN